MYLPAAAGDAGGAIGAAFAVARERTPLSSGPGSSTGVPSAVQGSRFDVQGSMFDAPSHLPSPISHLPSAASKPVQHFVMSHAYTGPQFDDLTIENVLQSRGLLSPSPVVPSPVQGSKFDVQSSKFDVQGSGPPSSPVTRHSSPPPELAVTHFTDPGELCRRTAKAISHGGVIGWFQGRMEWGPRALGNRSILCDPRRADMKEILNAKIKRRESFRPFAPSILREHVADWFEQEDDVPFMMEVFKFRPEKRALVPAVCHVDGSGRLQTVHRDTNPLYHQLISEFHSLTFIPMVLNTSFNENEPVVCRPEEALDCFLRTKMDVLVLGNFFVQRKS
jgi:carbamoyltransferase